MPAWHYRSRLAQVYEFARSRDEERWPRHEQAVELAPDNATMLMSLARLVLWHRRDARRARELLAQARGHALSDITRPFADLLEGLILLEEGHPRDALPVLEAAHQVFQARSHMPLGYLPVEHANLGRALAHAAARRERRGVEALRARSAHALVAVRSEMVDRCDRAIGQPQDG